MTNEEFMRWIADHKARFPFVLSHFKNLTPNEVGRTSKELLDRIRHENLTYAECEAASKSMHLAGFDGFYVKNINRLIEVGRDMRRAARRGVDGSCVTCRSTGFVSILILVTADGRKTVDGFRIVDYWRTVVATEDDPDKRRVAENRIHETTIRCMCERGQAIKAGSATFEPRNHITCWEPKTVRRDPAWWDAVEQEVCEMQESGFDAAPGYSTQELGDWR